MPWAQPPCSTKESCLQIHKGKKLSLISFCLGCFIEIIQSVFSPVSLQYFFASSVLLHCTFNTLLVFQGRSLPSYLALSCSLCIHAPVGRAPGTGLHAQKMGFRTGSYFLCGEKAGGIKKWQLYLLIYGLSSCSISIPHCFLLP